MKINKIRIVNDGQDVSNYWVSMEALIDPKNILNPNADPAIELDNALFLGRTILEQIRKRGIPQMLGNLSTKK